MEISLDPDSRKGQLLLTQFLGLEIENLSTAFLVTLSYFSF